MAGEQPHVVVVGGGPVGLSAAVLLARAGIRATVLERAEAPSGHPKARGVRTRTMELFAQWGLEEELRRGALPPEANRFIYCDSLAGAELARSPQPDDLRAGLSPTSVCRVAQDAVEEVLRRRVAALEHVTYRAGVAATGVRDAGDHVVVACAAGEPLRADYVIAADGVGSTVREQLGIPLEGPAVLGYGQSIHWRGDLAAWTHDRPCIQFLTGDRAGTPASVASVDGRYRWVTMRMRPGDGPRPEPPTVADAVAVVRRAVGADIEPAILDIATWRISAQVAASWRAGRVFLAGDAAHSFPPTGGFGMNTGVQDVHNLVWKLALVLRGQASTALLDSYETERKPVAASNAAWSVANGVRFRAIGRALAGGETAALADLIEEQRSHVDATDQDLGFGYGEGALVAGGEAAGPPLDVAVTGHRFPEVPLWFGDRSGSSALHLHGAFHVVTAEPARWQGPVAQVGSALGVPLATAVAGADGRAGKVLGGHEAALVRPDGIVAWTGPAAQLRAVLAELLA